MNCTRAGQKQHLKACLMMEYKERKQQNCYRLVSSIHVFIVNIQKANIIRLQLFCRYLASSTCISESCSTLAVTVFYCTFQKYSKKKLSALNNFFDLFKIIYNPV